MSVFKQFQNKFLTQVEDQNHNNIQKKVFTKWINYHLAKRNLIIKNLFKDLRDGSKLLILLEIIHDVKLLIPRKKTLDLVWKIIVSTFVSYDLLSWTQSKTEGYALVQVTDFTTSWRSGLAFNALLHAYKPNLFDYDILLCISNRENLKHAFNVAHQHFNVPYLLNTKDIDHDEPDERIVITYLSLLHSNITSRIITDDSTENYKHIDDKLQLKPSTEISELTNSKTQQKQIENPLLLYIKQSPLLGTVTIAPGSVLYEVLDDTYLLKERNKIKSNNDMEIDDFEWDFKDTENSEHQAKEVSIFDNVTLDTKPLKILVKMATTIADFDSKVPTYRTCSKNRGSVLIINNKKFMNCSEMLGSEIDVENLKQLFTQMHMKVEVEENKSKRDLMEIIKGFSKNEIHHNGVDMVFLIIMSHGTEGENTTLIYCSDDTAIESYWIEENFNNEQSPHLEGIPKIFIYQMCRGLMFDFGVRRSQDDSHTKRIIRTRDNMLIAHSTLPTYKSHRDIYLGSWYIQLICEVFMKHAYDTSIQDMLTMVDDKLSKLKSEEKTMQTSTYTFEGFKRCFINPGLYMEDNQIKLFETVMEV